MGRHTLNGLVVDLDGFCVLAVVSVETAQVEKGGYLGGLVRPRVLQAGAVQLGAPFVNLDRLFFHAHQGQD